MPGPPLPDGEEYGEATSETEPKGGVPGFLRALATVGSPLAVGTVLLFYFGWVRASRQAQALGYDTTVLDLTTPDYLLKSVGVLFVPMIVVLLVAIGLHRLHHRLVASRAPGPPPPRWLTGLRSAWLGAMLVGLFLFVAVPHAGEFVIPPTLSLAVLLYLYSKTVATHFGVGERLTTTPRVLLLLLLGLCLLWDTERLAGWYGTGYAKDIAAHRELLPSVTIYSKDRLLLSGPGVQETELKAPNAAYGYCYTGLELIQRSDDRYFLLAVGERPESGRLFVLTDGDTTRIELGR